MGGMVWSASELHYGHVTLIEVGYDAPARFCILGLVSLSLVVAEIWGEHSPHSVIFEIFEFGGGKTGHRFVRSGALVL
jgi:hypothetical protein